MIRDYRSTDEAGLLALNESNIPEVGPLDRDRLSLLTAEAKAVWILELGETVAGALILLEDGANYGSPNYQWFSERYETFSYVDRIMLEPEARGSGWGVKLYDRAVSTARAANKLVLAAEVNTIPPNERSVAFHVRYGFTELARERPYGPDEEVAMFVLTL